MVRLSTKYDEELKEQVFMVRGDEDYARSTAVDISIGTPTTTDLDFSVEISVNVLRDRGESSIVIYDDESVLAVIDDWKDTDTGRTITVEHLNYDTEHIFHAKYMGNNKCSPGVSKKIPLLIHDSRITNLTINSGNQFNPNTQITKTITISADYESQPSYFIDQPLLVYYDNVYVNTVRTDNQGKASISFNDSDMGLHELRVEYLGSDNLTPQVATIQLSIGYDFKAESYPELIINGANGKYSARLKDWFGNPLSDKRVYLQEGSGHQSITSGVTDSEGFIELTANSTLFRFSVNLDSNDYVTEDITVPFTTVTSLKVSRSNDYVVNGQSIPVRVEVVTRPTTDKSIPINITGAVNTTIYTNSNGVASFSITGKGEGVQTTTVENYTLNTPDYLEYWDKDFMGNKRYKTRNLDVMMLANYMRLYIPENTGYLGFYELPDGTDYTLILENVASTSGFKFLVGYDWDEDISNWYGGDSVDFSKLEQDDIKIVKQDTDILLYFNNVLKQSWHFIDCSRPLLVFMFDNPKQYLTFTALKFYKGV